MSNKFKTGTGKSVGPVGYIQPDKDTKVEIFKGSRGYAAKKDVGVVTFEVQGLADREDILFSESRTVYSKYISSRATLNLSGYTVPLWGEGHNLYPQEVYATVSENKLLPEVIRKQVKFLFGKGPRLYREQIMGEGENQKRIRVPVEDTQIQDWLDSWEESGVEHYWEYLKNIITDFYYVDTCVSKYNFYRTRRINGSLPIASLSYVGSDEARLAVKGTVVNKTIKDSDCKYVITGDWFNISGSDYQVYNRLDPAAPLKYPVAVAFNYDKTFTKWVYAFNNWFKGLKEYLKASELSPKYLNSYLKNALNAHIHAKIPLAWYEHHKSILDQICMKNISGEYATPLAEYRGVELIDKSGVPYAFYETMMDDLIGCELRRITALMSGEGKNQGKLYATLQYGEEGWVFEEFPGKFKDFFDTVIAYDKRADEVILANKGISSSITNVDSTGITSKSGNEAWYNYLMYVISLTLDEFFILKEINRAIQINFPHAKRDKIKLGFWIDIPTKLQDTTESQRPAGVAVPENN